MKCTLHLAVLCIVCTSVLLTMPARADLIAPAITHVYFEKDGMPYNNPVDFSVNCYGYPNSYPQVTKTAGSYQPELVFHYSASCDRYGCAIYQPYYLQYTHIDWCDLEGTTNNQTFNVENFSTAPYTRCDNVPNRVAKTWGDIREYYYDTPEYFACRQFERNRNETTVWADHLNFASTVPVNSSVILLLQGADPFYETPQWSHTIINKSDIDMDLNEYVRYLETCDPISDRKCPGWIINGTPLKTFMEYRTLKKNATDLMKHPCDTFLVKADPSLIMPFTDDFIWRHPCVYECNYTMEICELRSAIPTDTINATISEKTSPLQKKIPATGTTTSNLTLVPQLTTLPAVQRSPVESLYCTLLGFFGATC